MRVKAFQKDDFKNPFLSCSREQGVPESLKKLLEKMNGLVGTHSKSQLEVLLGILGQVSH